MCGETNLSSRPYVGIIPCSLLVQTLLHTLYSMCGVSRYIMTSSEPSLPPDSIDVWNKLETKSCDISYESSTVVNQHNYCNMFVAIVNDSLSLQLTNIPTGSSVQTLLVDYSTMNSPDQCRSVSSIDWFLHAMVITVLISILLVVMLLPIVVLIYIYCYLNWLVFCSLG